MFASFGITLIYMGLLIYSILQKNLTTTDPTPGIKFGGMTHIAPLGAGSICMGFTLGLMSSSIGASPPKYSTTYFPLKIVLIHMGK